MTERQKELIGELMAEDINFNLYFDKWLDSWIIESIKYKVNETYYWFVSSIYFGMCLKDKHNLKLETLSDEYILDMIKILEV